MSYLISNLKIKNSDKCGVVFYAGDGCKIIDGDLSVAVKSSEIFKFDSEVATLKLKSNQLNNLDDFFVKCNYNPDDNILKVQTDIIGYEPIFLFLNNDVFVLSDSLIKIIECLKGNNIKVSMSLESVRDQLCWGTTFGEATIVNGISRLGPARVYSLDCGKCELNVQEYEDFVPSKKVMSPKIAAENLYKIIDKKFSENPRKEEIFGLGLSGGLDSRVAAFFATRHHYKIKPFFIGNKYGKCRSLSYDARSSVDVQRALGLPEVTFVATDHLSWQERIENDLVYATSAISNAHNSVGYDFLSFDTLLNGAMGGELFGAVVTPEVPQMSEDELADYLLSYICFLPKSYPRGIISKIFNLPGRPVLSTDSEELMSKESWGKRKQHLLSWIKEQKNKGFSNVKIVQLDVYLRYAKNHSFGFFASLNRQTNSFPVYLWPSIIREMLSWDDDLFIGKKVQIELLKSLGKGLSLISSQAVPGSSTTSKAGFVARHLSRLEYWYRGPGMDYRRYVQEGGFSELEDLSKDKSGSLYGVIRLESSSWNLSPLLRTSMLKFSLLAQRYEMEIS